MNLCTPVSYTHLDVYKRQDVAYSHTNVKLIGISGGISYGALGMTHHSAQDIAALASIPGLRVYLPSDRFLTQALMEVLVQDNDPAYSRVGRNAVAVSYTHLDVYKRQKKDRSKFSNSRKGLFLDRWCLRSKGIISNILIYDHDFPRKAPTRNETRLVLPQ